MIGYEDVEAAARRIDGVAHRTPVLTSRALDEATGARVFLKAENLQRTGSFKLRGSLAKLRAIDPTECAGVVTGSAGIPTGDFDVRVRPRTFGLQLEYR